MIPIYGNAQSGVDEKDVFLDSEPFIRWAKEQAFLIQNSDSAIGSADLQPLKNMIGNARVVALGEPAHGYHEPLAFRNRLFRFLVENCGFTTVALEGGFAESRMAADFVAGGPGTANEVAANLSIGGPPIETIELLQWMRQYNAEPIHKRKLKFYGMDIQLQGLPGDNTPSHAAIDETLAYLHQVAPGEAANIKSALDQYLSRLSVAQYPLLGKEERIRLSAILDDVISLFERERINFLKSSTKERYDWAYRNAIVAEKTDRMVRVMPPDEPGKIPPDAWMFASVRDAAMADNIIWILDHAAAGDKVLVFAHNGHVKNEVSTGGVWDAFARPASAAGQYLKSRLGNDVFIIGSSCAPSLTTHQPGSLDRALLEVGKPRYLLNLRAATGNILVAAWLAQRRSMEANKVSYFMLRVNEAFDALLFIK